MKKNNINQKRRDFLKNTSLGVASASLSSGMVGAVLSKSTVAAEPELKTVVTAAHWGPIGVVVQDGKAVKSGAAIEPAVPNELQTVVADQLYSETRVKYPMVRKGYLENPGNSDTTMRGRDEWVRVSWEQALDLVHNQLHKVRQQHGSSAIYAGSYGWFSSGALHASRTLLQRYMNITGGFVGYKGDYSTGAAQVIMPHVLGTIEVYEQQTSWEVLLESSDIIVLWGANPLTTLRIAWMSSDQKGIEYFKKFQATGKRIICIDPIKSETCQMLGAEWIPVNTATDVPLMLGIAHTLVSENKHDKAFLKKYTTGYSKFEDYLLGKTDGQPKTAEWASKICGVPVEIIKQLANDFVTKRTMLMGGWGIQRQRHGEQSHWMLVTLASMLGQIGLPGGGFGFSYHYANGGVPTATGGTIGSISATPSVGTGEKTWLDDAAKFSFPVARIADALLNPGKTIDYNGTKITYPEIKVVYWAGGNPFTQHQNTNLLVKAFQKPETFIVNEVNWTPTARMADIVLPATTSYERNDLTMGGDYSMFSIYPMKQVVAPQFEAKNDFDIFAELAKRAGKEEEFTEGKTEMEWLEDFYKTAFTAARHNRVALPRFERFWEENKPLMFEANETAKKWVRYAEFREDPLLNPLGTPSGKIEIYSDVVAKMNYDDCKGHPSWMEPEEFAGNTTEDYPLALVTPHAYYRLHSQLAHTSLRQKYAVNDREPVLIHPEDAKPRGIVDGDIVRIHNVRGQVLAGAVVTEGIIKGTLGLHEGAWYDPLGLGESEKPLCKNGSPNVLTRDEGTSKLAQGNSPNTCIVQVEKYTGVVPEVTVFKQPKYSV
ncbi:trimethylamine-N-oxide reductase TorA [Rodentibacter caecimuris]|uniref:trimethylamine-N-oxide reductase n=1 Tax=Rodentibacter caecimuris TaxID=1796644 RepID=A0AAJ3K2B6_9PAST|nr:trimethylamine-N-oxide reductase TorA [Rodentibacter heylii]AOF54126.1 Trimethylamine-N-oxide reductase [Pasteurellaceae bacterium NI1060]OOF70106.1 trimethylamine N-oxide reductase I catalytic subunit [Rodentibacter heylii]OOF75081.1 trimethylamine N-oxide reductase I catalytic subunit [Rodentibacter heylii]